MLRWPDGVFPVIENVLALDEHRRLGKLTPGRGEREDSHQVHFWQCLNGHLALQVGRVGEDLPVLDVIEVDALCQMDALIGPRDDDEGRVRLLPHSRQGLEAKMSSLIIDEAS